MEIRTASFRQVLAASVAALALTLSAPACLAKTRSNPDDQPLAIPEAGSSTAAETVSEPKGTKSKAGVSSKAGVKPGASAPTQDNAKDKVSPAQHDTDTTSAAEPEAAPAAAPPAPNVWPADVVAAARARCEVVLKRINAIAIPEPPIKDGACGAPAPIQLISIGKNPQVTISPPAIITCELAEGLSQWLDHDLQPLARAHLNADIIKIETMSSYSCRNAYGRAKNKLSEHGVANALDIRGFVTSAAKTAYVLEDWGTPQREILAKIAAAKLAAEQADALRVAAEKAAQTNQVAAKPGTATAVAKTTPPSATASSAGAPASGIAKSSIADGLPKLTVTLPGAKKPETKSSLGFAEPDKLGGPRLAATSLVSQRFRIAAAGQGISVKAAVTPAQKSEFLHHAHTAACAIFGTTLGPEANADHRNHFHIDMAFRRVKKICE